jgi:hypothetical protein
MRTTTAIFLAGILAGCASNAAPTSAPTTSIAVTIRPGGGLVVQCNTVQLSVDVRNQLGDPVSPDSVKWSSSDSATVAVSSDGLIRALRPSPGVTVRAAVYRALLQGNAQAVFSVAAESGSCPP